MMFILGLKYNTADNYQINYFQVSKYEKYTTKR